MDTEHPLYYPIQIGLIASCAYISTSCVARFASFTPLEGTAFMVTLALVNNFITPRIADCLKSISDDPLAKDIHRVTSWGLSFLGAKMIIMIMGIRLSFPQIALITAAYLTAYCVALYALNRFRHAATA